MTTYRKRPVPPTHAEQHADKIAEAVQAAWFAAHGTGRIDTPMSVVATLAAAPRATDGLDVTDAMLEWTPDEFVAYAKRIWCAAIRRRPEVTHLLYPLVSLLFDDPSAEFRSQAHDVAEAALRAGQVDLTGTDRRYEVDLLGAVLTMLRPASAMKTRGQFYTPASVARLVASMSDVDEARRVLDPGRG